MTQSFLCRNKGKIKQEYYTKLRRSVEYRSRISSEAEAAACVNEACACGIVIKYKRFPYRYIR